MTQPYLTARINSSTHAQCAVFQEVNGALVQIGSDFGTIERTALDTDKNIGWNRVVNWNGNLYAAIDDGIWKYDVVASGDWGKIHTFGSAPFGNKNLLGLMPAIKNGERVLVSAYPTDTVNATFLTIDDNDVVTEGASISHIQNTFGAKNCWTSPIYLNGKIFYGAGGSNENTRLFYSYDVGGDSLTSIINHSSQRNMNTQMCVHNGQIYMVSHDHNATPSARSISLYKIAGATTIKLHSDFPLAQTESQNTSCALASIDGKLICMGFTGQFTFFPQMFEIILDSNGDYVSYTNISAATLPTELLSSVLFMQANWRLDNISDILGSGSVYELEFSSNTLEGTPTSIYRWNGPAAKMTLLGQGKDSWQHTRVSTTDGTGGERVWHGSGTLNCSMPKAVINGPNVDLSFNVYGANIAGVVLGVLFDKEGISCETQGTVIQTDVGTVEGIFASGITATPAGTPVTLKWAAASDGIATGDSPKFGIRVFIP